VKMRIVLLCYYGFEDFTIQLANSLSKENQVLLILPENIPRNNLEILDSKVRLLLVEWFSFFDPRNVMVYYQIMNSIRAFRSEVVHFQFNFRWIFFLPVLRKYPSVVTIHDVIPHSKGSFLGIGRCEKFNVFLMSRIFNQIIVHGKALKEQLVREYRVQREKVNSVSIWEHNVQLMKKWEKDTSLEEGNTVLFFGIIAKYKGVEYLIKAAPLISRELPKAKIVIAGWGNYFDKCRKLIMDKNSFEIYNYHISNKKAAELFQRCSLVVLPYIDASQSGVIPVAYAFKKPVIATNVGCLPEIVENGKTGYVVSPKDHFALAEKIVELLKNEELRKLMGENAYRKLKTDLSCDNSLGQIIGIYRKCLE